MLGRFQLKVDVVAGIRLIEFDSILIRLNCPEYFIGFRFNWPHGFSNDILHDVV
ncbi:MAG: hypothetical protein ACI9PU_001818, partial [Ascidiaceihabitans sp.]